MMIRPKRERRVYTSCWFAAFLFVFEMLGAYKLGELIVELFQ
jgi:hypothetical protein